MFAMKYAAKLLTYPTAHATIECSEVFVPHYKDPVRLAGKKRLLRTPGTRTPDWSFIHFTTPVRVYLNGRDRVLPPHTCLIYSPGTFQHYYCEEPLLHDWFHFTGDPIPLFEKLGIRSTSRFAPPHGSSSPRLSEKWRSSILPECRSTNICCT